MLGVILTWHQPFNFFLINFGYGKKAMVNIHLHGKRSLPL